MRHVSCNHIIGCMVHLLPGLTATPRHALVGTRQAPTSAAALAAAADCTSFAACMQAGYFRRGDSPADSISQGATEWPFHHLLIFLS
jgi:hypothetical protein